jgi:hypothetical protein
MNRFRQDKPPGAVGAQGERVVKTGLKMGSAFKSGAAALALCMLTGNAWAATSCARPQEMMALRTAALQQRLMVAALACHDAADYNRFVVSHQRELQDSDRALMRFFVRQDAQKGTDDYNTYKTGLANDASLHSVRDPRFCRSAKAAFDDELRHKVSIAELVSQRASMIRTGYESCMPSGRENVMMADATPGLPARHQAFSDDQSSDLDPNLTSRMDRALPPPLGDEGIVAPPSRGDGGVVEPPRGAPRYARPNPARDASEDDADRRNAYAPDAGDPDAEGQDDADNDRAEGQYAPYVVDDAPRYDPEYADRASQQPPRAYGRNDDRNGRGYGQSYRQDRVDNVEDQGGYDAGPIANNARGDERGFYDRPSASRPYLLDRPYTDRPTERPRFVRGPDGRWYLLRRRY